MPRRIAIMSDHPVVRAGLWHLVGDTGAQVVLETGVRDPLALGLRRDTCDGVILDLGTAHVAAILAICETTSRTPAGPPLIGVECCGREPPWIFRVIRAGLAAYVSLAADSRTLADALDAVYRGLPLIRLQRSEATLRERMSAAQQVSMLSGFDRRLLLLLNMGLRDREVADELKSGASTVKHHVEMLEGEFNLRTRFQLGVLAHEWGLVSAGSTTDTALSPEPIRAPRTAHLGRQLEPKGLGNQT